MSESIINRMEKVKFNKIKGNRRKRNLLADSYNTQHCDASNALFILSITQNRSAFKKQVSTRLNTTYKPFRRIGKY